MPHFRLETNVPQNKIPADLAQKLCKVLSKSLGKPINYCVATVIGGVNMSWGGTTSPAAQATLMSIGSLGINENKKHSECIFELITQELNIPPDRMYITFTNASTSDVGYNGTTFLDFFG